MKKTKRFLFGKFFKYALLVSLGAFFIFILYLFFLLKDLPSVDQLTSVQVAQSTKIYDRTGKVLLYEINAGQKRTVLSFDQIPQTLKDATLVAEDRNFYSEPGFSWTSYIRAILVNLRHGLILQGGSTITQQLAKNAFLSPEQTLARKLKELLLSIQLSRHYSKDQILGFYLNQIPYGPTTYGVESASRAYFGKSANDLNIAESALLAALPRAPSYYSPWGSHQKELFARQQYILSQMYDAGKITKDELDKALRTQIVFSVQNTAGIHAPHFVLAVQDYLTQKYGEEIVMKGGLNVITTLDWDMQQAAEKAVADGAKQNEILYKGKNAALIAEDANTGQILSMVGSRDYFDTKNEGNFNVATQGRRQPGSALKPFIYLTAFEKGFTPDTTFFDVPTEFSVNPACSTTPDFSNEDTRCFHPENYDGQFRGPVSARNALAQSINVPAVQALYLAGISNVLKTAGDFGITTLTSPSQYGLSLVLGGGAVKLIDLVEAYSVLAQEGTKHDQEMILEVKDRDNKVIESFHDNAKNVVDPQYPRLINDILSDTDARKGLFQNSLALTTFPDQDVALKTGTSNDYRDAWVVGYTPSLVVGVWAGNNDNAPMQKHGSSILAAVPIWHAFMEQALKNRPLQTFTRPDPISVSKPILAGNYLANQQIHSVLYYVDRNDPTGPEPEHPENDSQFKNWESSVLAWASRNLQNFSTYNQASTTMAPGTDNTDNQGVQIQIKQPTVGGYYSDPLNIEASVNSNIPIHTIRIYLNHKTVYEESGSFGKNFTLNKSLTPQIDPQNLLEVETVDQNNSTRKTSLVFYKSN